MATLPFVPRISNHTLTPFDQLIKFFSRALDPRHTRVRLIGLSPFQDEKQPQVYLRCAAETARTRKDGNLGKKREIWSACSTPNNGARWTLRSQIAMSLMREEKSGLLILLCVHSSTCFTISAKYLKERVLRMLSFCKLTMKESTLSMFAPQYSLSSCM